MSVYFLQDSLSKDIKIGSGGSPKQRRSDLQTGNPRELILLGTLPGGQLEEKTLHRQFDQYRLKDGGGKEWFRYDKDLFRAIQKLLMLNGTPSTVWDEYQRRECRYGLRGVEVTVRGFDESFFVWSSRWNAQRALVLSLWPEDQQSPQEVWRQPASGGSDLVVRCLADYIGTEYPDGFQKDVPADQCILLSEWPQMCSHKIFS